MQIILCAIFEISDVRVVVKDCVFVAIVFLKSCYIMDAKKISRLVLHEVAMKNDDKSTESKKRAMYRFILDTYGLAEEDKSSKNILYWLEHMFFPRYFQYWKSSNRTSSVFMKKHNVWLQEEIIFPESVCCDRPSTSDIRGRPSKSIAESSVVIKRRRAE